MNIYAPEIDPVEVRRRIGMVFQKAQPVPQEHLRERGLGCADQRLRGNMDELVEQSLRQAALWDEVKDKLNQSGLAPFRRATATALHRAHLAVRPRSS